jgi:hypothetical protein
VKSYRIHYRDGRLGPICDEATARRILSGDIIFMEDVDMKPKMDIFIRGMQQRGIKMEVSIDNVRRSLYYWGGDYYVDEQRVSELVIRRELQAHYTADRRRVKDWQDDVSHIEGQLSITA